MSDNLSILGVYIQNEYFIYLAVSLSVLFILSLMSLNRVFSVKAGHLRLITKILYFYVFLSSFLFLISLPYGILLKLIFVSILLYFFIRSVKKLSDSVFAECGYRLRVGFAVLFVGLLLLSHSSLFWGYGFVPDWRVHRTKLKILYDDPIGPSVDFDMLPANEENNRLTYYYSLFLPAAYATKYAAYFIDLDKESDITYALSVCFFLWVFFGVLLAVFLLVPAFKKMFDFEEKFVWGVAYFIVLAFSGVNWWHLALEKNRLYVGHSEWSAPYFAQYSSFISIFQWSPFHIGAGLIGLVFLGLFWSDFNRFPLTLWSVFLVSSSVFCYIGVIPLLAVKFLGWVWSKRRFPEINREAVAAGFLTFFVLLFYLTKVYPESISLNRSLSTDNYQLRYLTFLLIELLPVAIIVFIAWLEKIRMPSVVAASILFLSLLPVAQLGRYNDIVLRASVPALIVLATYCGYVIERAYRSGSARSKFLVHFFILMIVPCFVNEYLLGLLSGSANVLTGAKLRYLLGFEDVWGVFFNKLFDLFELLW